MKNVVVLGSTGSLGTQTLELLKLYSGDFKLVGLTAHKNGELLQAQAEEFKVGQARLSSKDGEEALTRAATLKEADIVINVLAGICGIQATKAALKAGKTVLLGNKESLIAEGGEIMKLAGKDQIIPLDSEHNAIFEILKKHPDYTIKNIILPCSGGPFLGMTLKDLEKVTIKETLKHPKWNMGAKISVESATLLNKGFELIEAHYLFGLPFEQIKVLLHPQCRVHGIVEFEEANIAYISEPNMKEHIENALLHSLNRPCAAEIRPIDYTEFELKEADHKNFPGIQIVLEHFQKNPSAFKDFLKKEQELIQNFLAGEITMPQIYRLLS